MSVVRVVKTRGYTVMSNCHLRDKRLSLKAKGLLSVMLSLPEEWDYTVRGLASISLEGIDAVRGGIAELERAGYVTRQRIRGADGRLGGCDYTVYERPPAGAGFPGEGAPALGKPMQGAPAQEDRTQLITEGRRNEEEITETATTEEGDGPPKPRRHRHGRYGNVLLSESDVEKLMAEFPVDWQARIERLDEYVETSGRRYKNHLATIRSWARNDAKRTTAANADDVYAYDEADVL